MRQKFRWLPGAAALLLFLCGAAIWNKGDGSLPDRVWDVYAAEDQGADDIASDSSSTQVFDDAGLLTSEEIAGLTEAIEGLEIQSGWDVMALTIADADGYSAQEYGELFFNAYAVSEDGVVCIVDMDNREIALVTAGEAIRYLTDARIEDTLDYAYESVSAGSYGDALNAMILYVSYYYGEGIPEGQVNYDTDTGEYSRYEEPKGITRTELIIALIAGIAVMAAFALIITGRYRLKIGVEKDGFAQHSRLHLTRNSDRLINRYVTTRRIPKNPPPGHGGGGGGSISTTHGGGSFGGGSRKF